MGGLLGSDLLSWNPFTLKAGRSDSREPIRGAERPLLFFLLSFYGESNCTWLSQYHNFDTAIAVAPPYLWRMPPHGMGGDLHYTRHWATSGQVSACSILMSFFSFACRDHRKTENLFPKRKTNKWHIQNRQPVAICSCLTALPLAARQRWPSECVSSGKARLAKGANS